MHLSLRLLSIILVATMLLLGLAIAGGQRIHTSTFIVTSTGDSGAGSLRQALADANDGDTIQFDAALNGQTINLTSSELAINKNVTINGPGPSQLAVERMGGSAFRIFHVMPGHTVTISGLTITGGSADGGGHGVRNDQSVLTIDNCNVQNNRGDLSPNGGDGGGIYNNKGTLTITNSTIADNFARVWGGFGDGGGIYSVGILEIANSTISGNIAYLVGGGIYCSGSLQIANSTINSNGAGFMQGNGGGIVNLGTGTISNSTVSGNGANASHDGDPVGYNGGIFNGGTLQITNSTVSNNTASHSSGGVSNSGTLTIVNSTISGNSALFGGGISNSGSNATLEIENTILKAGSSGANIFNSAGTVTSHGYNLCSDDGAGFLTATGDRINIDPMIGPLQDNGGPTFTHALLGGSPAIDAGDPNFTPPPFYDQRGPEHTRVFSGRIDIGSFETQPTGTVLMVMTTVDNGPGSLRDVIAAAHSGDTIQFAAALDGQTIALTSGELVIDKSITVAGPGASRLTVQRSTVAGTPAFRICEILASRVVTMQGLTISNGYAPDSSSLSGSGGGISNSGTLTMMDCALIGNGTDGVGGGIVNGSYGPILTMINCTLSGNVASIYGGGIYNGGVLTMTNCVLSSNQAGDQGGGIYNASTLTMSNSTLNSNSAYNGGGIYNIHSPNTPVMTTNSTLSGNTAYGTGGGIYDAAGMVLTHSTLSGNSADSGSGGGIHHDSSICCAAFEIESTIFNAGTSGTNISNNTGTVTSHGYNLSSDNGGGFLTATGDQVNTDPMLGPLQDNGGPTFTHLPQTGSPAINAGDPNFTPPPLYDQRGYARVFNNRIDIGSIEVQPLPIPTPTPTSTPTASPTPIPTPTATPSPTAPAQSLNLSSRMLVQAGDRVGIAGLIISGSAPKRVIVRVVHCMICIPEVFPLVDPVLELHGPNGFATIINDNWRDAQEAEIITTGLPPDNNSDSAIVVTLPPGNYTAVVRGKNNTTGVAVVEVYDLNQAAASKLANISTRAFVSTGGDILIAGFILGHGTMPDNVILRGIGPSLTGLGVPDALANPTLELRDSQGALIRANDNWMDDPAQKALITAAGLAPANPLESAIAETLPPGQYTALLDGVNNGTGNGLVEVYDLGP